MDSTPPLTAAERLRASLGRRGVSLLLALAVEALIALLLLLFLAPVFKPKEKRIPDLFVINPGSGEPDEAKEAVKEKPKAKGGAAHAGPRIPQPAQPQPVATPPPVPAQETTQPAYLRLTRDQITAADIGRIPSQGPRVADSSGPGDAADGDSRIVSGRGPHGEPLYAAEWYREPTDAELSPFLAKARGPGWGLVACRTVDRFHVEDCQELGESPRGSGLSRAVREAAWQFLVRPPRVGGKPLVGSWVRIRIDYGLHQAD